MSIESKVFLQLEKVQPSDKNKIELEQHRIEFVLLDRALKLADTLEKMAAMIKEDGEKQNMYADKVASQGPTLMAQWQNGSRMIDEISITSKNLGIDPNSLPEVKRIIAILDTILTYRKRYNF